MDDLRQNPESGECRTQRLTLGLSTNPESGNLDTSQRLTLGLVKTTESVNLTTQRLTLGLYENPESGNPYTSQRLPPLSPLSPINIVHPSKGRRGSYL